MFLLVGWLFKLNYTKDLVCTHPSLDTRKCSFRRDDTNVITPRKVSICMSHGTIRGIHSHCHWLLGASLFPSFLMHRLIVFSWNKNDSVLITFCITCGSLIPVGFYLFILTWHADDTTPTPPSANLLTLIGMFYYMGNNVIFFYIKFYRLYVYVWACI